MKIEFLYFDGCPSHREAWKMLQEVLNELKIRPEIKRINVKDNEMAKQHKFFGSPTIRINGEDVDPKAEKSTNYRRGCRIYVTEDGIKEIPSKNMIRDAIIKAKQ